MTQILSAILLVSGTLLMLVAAIGILRLKDPLQRMHSSTKAGTLGTILLVTGVLLGSDDAPRSNGILVILFLMLTLPLAAQLLGRATYLSGTRLTGIEDGAIPELEAKRKNAVRSDEG